MYTIINLSTVIKSDILPPSRNYGKNYQFILRKYIEMWELEDWVSWAYAVRLGDSLTLTAAPSLKEWIHRHMIHCIVGTHCRPLHSFHHHPGFSHSNINVVCLFDFLQFCNLCQNFEWRLNERLLRIIWSWSTVYLGTFWAPSIQSRWRKTVELMKQLIGFLLCGWQ